MAYVITQPCVGVKDGECTTVCPVDAIHPTRSEAGFAEADQLFIDPRECICCGLCVDVCPVNAIFDEGDVPLEWTSYIAKNAAHFEK